MASTTWKHPKTGAPLAVDELVLIDAGARLGPSAVGLFRITGFTDEGVVGEPAFHREDYADVPIRFQPEDIRDEGTF